MNRSSGRRPHRRDQRGASLVLALGVMLAIGGIVGGLVTFINTSQTVSVRLQSSRNRQYAADAAVEQAIRVVQYDPSRGLLGNYCSVSEPFLLPPAINGYSMRVNCFGVPAPRLDSLNRIIIERNVLFLACIDNGSTCDDTNSVIKAKVNFPTDAAGTVTGAFVQSWSVS